MSKNILFWIGLLISPIVFADTPMVPHQLAPSPQTNSTRDKASTKPEPLLRLAPPTMSVTRAVRMPDGSIQLQCVQRLNPKSGLYKQRKQALSPEAH